MRSFHGTCLPGLWVKERPTEPAADASSRGRIRGDSLWETVAQRTTLRCRSPLAAGRREALGLAFSVTAGVAVGAELGVQIASGEHVPAGAVRHVLAVAGTKPSHFDAWGASWRFSR